MVLLAIHTSHFYRIHYYNMHVLLLLCIQYISYQELEYATHDCVQVYVVYYVMCIYMR